VSKVLVTGAEGFIGSHLVETLLREGVNVRAFALYNSNSDAGWLKNIPENLKRNLEIHFGDVRDPWSVTSAFRDIETVYHLAALIAIPYSYQAPASYIDTNVKGTLNVLQAAREHKTSRVLITSTSEVYGSALSVPINETHPRQGQSPYSASKIGADSLTESYIKSFDLPATIVRPFNTFGPRQSARAVIPTIITQLLDGVTEIKMGSTSPTRDFNFVEDTASGFIEIAKSERTIGEEINIASGEEISMGDLAQNLITTINPDAVVIEDTQRVRPENSEVSRLLGDNSKIKELTNWTQKHTFLEGLEKTVEWFRDDSNRALYDSQNYNI
jgi:NAD dependent epimerase/dehydratase